MSERRVDLLVPGPEGGWLARALEQAGMVTFRRDPGQPPSHGVGVVVVALSREAGSNARDSFEAQLAQAREGLPPETPLVALLPVDAHLDEGLRSLAQGVYPRPVPVARLVHKIEALLDTAEGGGPRPSWSPEAPLSADAPVLSQKPSVPPAPSEEAVRERTMRLDDPELSSGGSGAPPPARLSSRPHESYSGSGYYPASHAATDGDKAMPMAPLSPWLHAILSECDRNMFPAAPPLDLRFPASDDGPLELVPRVFLDVFGESVAAPPGDPFEGHSFAGDALWVGQSLPRKRHSEWPRLESSAGGGSSSSGRVASNSSRPRIGSHPGSNPGSRPESSDGSHSGPRSAVRASEPPVSSLGALPSVPHPRTLVPREAGPESIVAPRPDHGDGHRSDGAKPSSPPEPGRAERGSKPPYDTRRGRQVPDRDSADGPPGGAGLYETAVEAQRYPSRPSPPVLSVGTPTADGRGRWGTLAPDAWPLFALALGSAEGAKRLSLRMDRGAVVVCVHAGEVLAPVDAAMEARGAAAQRVDGERVDPLAELHWLRLGRHAARERVLAALTPVSAAASRLGGGAREGFDPELVFEVYDLPAGGPAPEGWPLGSLLSLLLEALAGWVTAAWLSGHWGDRLDHALVVDPSAAEWAARLGLDGLWVDWLRRWEGRPLADLLDALPDSEGLPCALLVLAGVGAIRFDGSPREAKLVPPILELRARARRLIERAYAASRNADYFTLLDVRPSASARAVERACAARMAPLLGLDLETLGLGELAPLRTDVLECYAEAQRALRDDDSRTRYARALGLLGSG